MNTLYRLTWVNPENGKKCANWWTLSKDVAESDREKVEKEYGVVCRLEQMHT